MNENNNDKIETLGVPDISNIEPKFNEPIEPLTKETKPKKKAQKWLIITLLCLLALSLGYFGYQKFILTPKKVFTIALKSLNTKINSSLSDNISSYSGFMTYDSNRQDNNNFYANINYGVDTKNQLINIGLTSKYQNEDLLSTNISLKNDKIYFYLDGIFDKYLYTDVTKLNMETMNTTDLKKCENSLHNAIIASLKDEYLTKEITNQSIIYNLNLTNNQYQQFIKDILTYLQSDSDFVSAYAKLLNKSTTEVTNILTEDLNNVGDKTSLKVILTTSVWTNNLKSIYLEDNTNNSTFKLTLNVIDKNNFTYTLETNTTPINYYYEQEYSLNDTSKETTKYTGTIMLSNIDNELIFKIVINDENNNTYTLSGSMVTNGTIKDIDVSNAIDINDLTEEDTETMMNKLFSKKGLVALYQSLFSTTDLSSTITS